MQIVIAGQTVNAETVEVHFTARTWEEAQTTIADVCNAACRPPGNVTSEETAIERKPDWPPGRLFVGTVVLRDWSVEARLGGAVGQGKDGGESGG